MNRAAPPLSLQLESTRMHGVDDLALRRGQVYATILMIGNHGE